MARVHLGVELRWADQDAYGHINNVSYARFLEESRVRVFFTGQADEATGMEGYFRGSEPEDPLMLVASQCIEFLSVLEYSRHPLRVELWIGRLGGSSLDINYELFDGSSATRTLVARAVTTVVIADRETGRPVRLSDEGRNAVQPWTDVPLRLRRSA